MAQGMERVTKKELVQKLSVYNDNDFVGVISLVQDGKESECHQVLIFFHATDNLC